MARRYDAAIEQGTRTTQLFPDFMPGHAYLGLAQLESGRPREALASFETARKGLDIVVVRTWLARAHLAAGDRDAAMRIARALESSRDYLPPYYMAALYADLGDRDRAQRELARARRGANRRAGVVQRGSRDGCVAVGVRAYPARSRGFQPGSIALESRCCARAPRCPRLRAG